MGIVFLIYGVFKYISFIIVKGVADSQLLDADIPALLDSCITNLVSDTLNPLELLAIGSIILGAVLLVTSLLYKRRQT